MRADSPAAEPCPLCGAAEVRPYAETPSGRFLACDRCGLVFRPAAERPAPAAELAHYGTHRNDPSDARYRAFLERLAGPLAARAVPGGEGLDYGSGPGPALSDMLRERGFRMTDWDPFFAADPAPLGRAYDLVACSETAEHFHHPGDEFARLDGLLRPGGVLGVMTQMISEDRPFETWRYARDPTHACFYRPATMAWIARRFGWSLQAPRPDVVLFGKPAEAAG